MDHLAAASADGKPSVTLSSLKGEVARAETPDITPCQVAGSIFFVNAPVIPVQVVEVAQGVTGLFLYSL